MLFSRRFFPIFALLVLSSCAPYSPQIALSRVQGLSPKAEATFAYLQMEQAIRADDKDTLLLAAQKLLSHGPAAQPLVEAGGWLLSNGYFQDGYTLLQKSQPLFPDDLSLVLLLSAAMQETGQMDEALSLMQGYRSTHPNEKSANLEMALFFLNADKAEESLGLFREIPKSQMSPSAYYYYAQALAKSGDLNQAAQQLNLAIKDAPDFLEALLELAYIEEMRNNIAKAQTLYQRILDYDPGNQDILLRLITLALNQGNPQKALSLALAPGGSFGFKLTTASMFMDQGRFDLAKQVLAPLETDPEMPPETLFYQAVILHEGEGKPLEALAKLALVPKENEYYTKALRMQVQIQHAMGNTDLALQSAARARKDYPEEIDFWNMELELLSNYKKYDEALALTEQALKDWPFDEDLLFQQGFYYYHLDQKPKGLALMEELITLNPEHVLALNFVGYSLADENRDLKRALALLEKAVELSPESGFILDSLAWAQYRLAQYQDAWDNIQKAVKLTPQRHQDDGTLWLHMGDIAHALGKKAEARTAWIKAQELGVDDPQKLQEKMDTL